MSAVIVALAALMLALGGPASAQVIFDEGGPSDKEYEIPTDDPRTLGGGGNAGSGDRSTFGEGITPADESGVTPAPTSEGGETGGDASGDASSGAAGGGKGSAGGGPGSPEGAGAVAPVPTAEADVPAQTAASSAEVSDGGSNGGLLVAAAILFVLALCGFAALGLRRLQQRQSGQAPSH